jgi:hypothetical protein
MAITEAALAAVFVAHMGDVISTNRNLRLGLDEDAPFMRWVIKKTGGFWPYVKMTLGLALAGMIYVTTPPEISAPLNAFWVGFLASTAMRNWMAGSRRKARITH